jgi:hypothetical protein
VQNIYKSIKQQITHTLLLLVAALSSFSVLAGSVETFNNVEVNPREAPNHKVVATVHLVTDIDITLLEQKLAARESVAIALSSMSNTELTSYGAIEMAKSQITKQLRADKLLGDNSIEQIYVTDLVVVYVGPQKSINLSPR